MGVKPFTYLLLYFPIALVTSLVLTAAKEESARTILRKGLRTFGLLTLAMAMGSVAVWFVSKVA
jgi:hypothetical protein